MKKVFWFDCETTGLNCSTHAIIQLSSLIELDGEIVEELDLCIKPFPGALIDERALSVNKVSMDTLETYPVHRIAYSKLIDVLNKYVDKYKKNDKFVLAGYNVNFDDGFFRSFFTLNNDKYYGSYFAWPKIDVACYVAEEYSKGLRLSNFQLGTLCETFGIPLEAHNALGDIKATRDLYYRLREGKPLS